jgi:hypothetical protein
MLVGGRGAPVYAPGCRLPGLKYSAAAMLMICQASRALATVTQAESITEACEVV